MKTFAINEANLERLNKKLNRIRTKCNMYGCDFYYAEVGEEFRTFNEGTTKEHVERYVLVEAEGTAIVNGWKFIATLEHTEAGNIVRSLSDEVPVPKQYYTCEPGCDHCKSKRHRKDTYLIYNVDTKEFKQVGSSCLCDFTHGLSAEAAAAYISLYDSLIEGEYAPVGPSYERYFKVNEILAYAIDYVDNFGYVRTNSYDKSTLTCVMEAYRFDHGSANSCESDVVLAYRDVYSPKYNSVELLDRINQLKDCILKLDDISDYIHNLQVILSKDYCTARQLGYLVSAVQCYNREADKLAAKAAKEEQHQNEVVSSNYVGEVGEKLFIENVKSVEVVTSYETAYGFTTQVVYRYKITDTDGNILMWDTQTYIDVNANILSIKGTVKKLDEFRGVKQTWMTRCKVTYAPTVTTQRTAIDDFNDSYKFFEDAFKDAC